MRPPRYLVVPSTSHLAIPSPQASLACKGRSQKSPQAPVAQTTPLRSRNQLKLTEHAYCEQSAWTRPVHLSTPRDAHQSPAPSCSTPGPAPRIESTCQDLSRTFQDVPKLSTPSSDSPTHNRKSTIRRPQKKSPLSTPVTLPPLCGGACPREGGGCPEGTDGGPDRTYHPKTPSNPAEHHRTNLNTLTPPLADRTHESVYCATSRRCV